MHAKDNADVVVVVVAVGVSIVQVDDLLEPQSGSDNTESTSATTMHAASNTTTAATQRNDTHERHTRQCKQ